MSHNADVAAVIKIIIENVHRLLGDANVLLDKGSPGSARSLAILAFEEAGKGHALELRLKKPSHIRSHHEFRHAVGSFVLLASICQKYGIDMKETNVLLESRTAGITTKDRERMLKAPIDPAFRSQVAESLVRACASLSAPELLQYQIEMRWLAKIGQLVAVGGVEKLRQAGLYVDFDETLKLASSPMAVEKVEAFRWILSATRVIKLLEHGEYFQSYSPLSEFMTDSGRKFERPEDLASALLDYVKQIEGSAGEGEPPEGQ